MEEDSGAGVGRPEEQAAEAAAAGPSVDEKVALSPSLWVDPDVQWLTGIHEAEGHAYLVRERYEELLWWLLMPSLLRVAGQAAPKRAELEAMSRIVDEALATAEAAGFRVDLLLNPEAEAGTEAPEPEETEVAASGEADAPVTEPPAEPVAIEAEPLVAEESPLEGLHVYGEGVSADEAVAEMAAPHEAGEPAPWESQ